MEWMENLPDELKGNEGLKKFQSIESLAKSYLNIESMQGNSLRIPSEEAGLDDRAKFYNKVIERAPELMLRPNPNNSEQMKEYYTMSGVPEDIDGYSTDGVELDAALLSQLKTLAKKNNFSQAQWKGYVSDMTEMQGVTIQQTEDSRVRQGAELKTVWGMAFEDRYSVVERFLEERPGYGKIEHQSPQQMVEHYETAKSLKGTKQMYNQPASASRRSPDEAKAKIIEIDNNPRFRSNDPQDRLESIRLAKLRVELLRESDPSRYAE